jgi:cellulose synthase/poly-beta-1,6-N-acetylglucosamine synthase-like glycosyltransferase
MAYNEEANVGRLLEAILSQRTETADVAEIIVVASGCTDNTEAIVRHWMSRDPRIRLIVQTRREGKAAAVNCFLAAVREKVLLLCSADLLPAPDTIEELVAPFANPEVALATSRPTPVDDRNRFMGFAAHMLWELHHQINLVDFKAGELIAFRRVFERIPVRTAVDEASVESLIRGQGYEVRYVATAVTYNKGPETIRDFLRQRRRIYAGHLALRDGVGYRVATLSGLRILWLLPRALPWRPWAVLWAMAVMMLEVWGRFLGWRDYKKRRDHRIWEIATSTKRLAAAPTKRPAA